MIIDEISKIGREAFGHLDLELKVTMKNWTPFGGVSLLVVIYLLQFAPFNQIVMFMEINVSMGIYGKNSNYMSWLKIFGRAVIQILLNYLNRAQESQTSK